MSWLKGEYICKECGDHIGLPIQCLNHNIKFGHKHFLLENSNYSTTIEYKESLEGY